MTHLLYQTDSYLKEFDATVTAVDARKRHSLDQTAFYPGGGGQPHDTGQLGFDGQTVAVTKVARQGAQVWHTVAGDYARRWGRWCREKSIGSGAIN